MIIRPRRSNVTLRCLTAAALVLMVGLASPGQTTTQVFVPSDTPATGPCSALPITPVAAPGGHLIRLAAASLGSGWNVVDQIAFAPCVTTQWIGNDTVVVVGNLSPASAAALQVGVQSSTVLGTGQFTDFSVVHDSDRDGPLTMNAIADTWCTLTMSRGRLHVWDGTSDLGIWLQDRIPGTVVPVHTTTASIASVCTAGLLYAGPRVRLTTYQAAAVPTIVSVAGTCWPWPEILAHQLPFLGTRLTIQSPGTFSYLPPNQLYLADSLAAVPYTIAVNCTGFLDISSALEWIAAGASPIQPVYPPTALHGLTTFQIPADPALAGATVALQMTTYPAIVTFPAPETTNALLLTLN